MKKIIQISLLVFLLISSFIAQATTHVVGSDTLYYFNNNYYFVVSNDTILIDSTVVTVKFVDNTPQTNISSFVTTYNLTLRHELFPGNIQYYMPSGQNFVTLGNSITNDPLVENMDIHYYMQLFGSDPFEPNDDDISDQWYLKNIGVYDEATLEGVWEITKGNSNVVIAVLDEGVDWELDEFGPVDDEIDVTFQNTDEADWSLWNNPDSGNDNDDEGNGYIDDWKGYDFIAIERNYNNCTDNWDNGLPVLDNDSRPGPTSNNISTHHGSAIAGIIAAKTNNDNNIAGIGGGDAENGFEGLKIMPVKVADYDLFWTPTSCNESWVNPTLSIQEGIVYAVDNGAKVITMSMGVNKFQNETINDEIEYAQENGVIFVAAAGNDGSPYIDNIAYPANNDYVIAVGSTDQNDEYCSFSNQGPEIEIAAPGVDLTILDDDGYTMDEQWGTSYSTPMVAATVGLMLSVNPHLSNGGLNEDGSIRNILKRTADETGEMQYDNGWNRRLGYGRLNTYDAVCMAIDYKPEIVVSNNDTWDERVISNSDIIIESGVELTITGEVFMGKDTRIIIEPRAVLTIDGGIVTNMPFCGKEDEKWGAIEVRGIGSGNQFEYTGHAQQQGKLILKDAIIENAIVGVRTFAYETTFSSTGGIVHANNTTFRNNNRAISMYPYENIMNENDIEYDYQASFTNCTFTVNDDYIDEFSSFKSMHFMLYGVKGIMIKGCTFENKLDANPSGKAIYTNDAGFIIKGACESQNVQPCPTGEYHNTSFYGFYSAIESVNTSNALYGINIRETNFLNNGYGIHFSAVNDAVVVGNTFDLGIYDDCTYDAGTGIFLDNCKRFAIEDNYFTVSQQTPAVTYVGIHTKNTKNMFDEIYDNKFDKMVVANYAEGKNWDTENKFGLAYYCNENTNNFWDFYVEEVDYGFIDGIQKFQGNKSFVAGNKFSPAATGHFINYGDYEIDYYYDLNSTSETPVITERVELYPINLSNTCPPHYEGEEIRLTTTQYQQRESDYSTALSSYNYAVTQYGAASDSVSRRYWQEEMSHYNMLLSRAAYDIIRSNLADTLVQDSLFGVWQKNLGTYASEESMVEYYMQKGDYTTAMNKLDSLQYNFVFSAYDSIEYPYYSELKELQKDWLVAGRDIFSLTSTEIDKLVTIADSSYGVAGAQARGMLTFIDDSLYSYTACISTPDTTQKSAWFNGDSSPLNNNLEVKVMPVPADDQLIFEYVLPEDCTVGEFLIYDNSGRIVEQFAVNNSGKKTIDVSGIQSGIYLYRFNAGRFSKTGKIIINH